MSASTPPAPSSLPSSSSSSLFSFPPLRVSDDVKESYESYPPSLFSSTHPNYRTIEALPSPSSSNPSPFVTEQPLYRSTAALAELEDNEATWAPEHGFVPHKELTLTRIREVGELPVKVSQLPEVRVAPRDLTLEVPCLPPTFEGQYALASPRPCEVIMATLPSCLESYHVTVSYEVHPSKPRLSGVFYEDHTPVQFRVNAFHAPEMGAASTVIEVQRRCGHFRAFHSFFLFLQDKLAEAGILQAELHRSHHPMESTSPPPLDGEEDDAALDLIASQVFKAKAVSLNHSEAREGLLGLVVSSAPLHIADVCPLTSQALAHVHDPEQQRLALTLLQRSLVSASPSSTSHVKPLMPALFDCMGDLPPSYTSVHAARSLTHICDSVQSHPQLSPLIAERAELVGQVRQIAGMVRV